MKRMVIEVPDYVDSSLIFYRDGDSFRYVNPKVVDEFPIQLNVTLSDEEIEKVNKHIKEAMRKSAVMVFPSDPTASPSRKEFEALRSRVEKLERESERQCARVIKMEEGISDDLK